MTGAVTFEFESRVRTHVRADVNFRRNVRLMNELVINEHAATTEEHEYHMDGPNGWSINWLWVMIELP